MVIKIEEVLIETSAEPLLGEGELNAGSLLVAGSDSVVKLKNSLDHSSPSVALTCQVYIVK